MALNFPLMATILLHQNKTHAWVFLDCFAISSCGETPPVFRLRKGVSLSRHQKGYIGKWYFRKTATRKR